MSIKKFVCVAAATILCTGLFATASAEIRPNAIGLRLGGGSLFGAEVNYQKGLNANRLELGASWGYNSYEDGVWWDGSVRRYHTHSHSSFGVIGFYQWHFSNIADVRGLNWYVGPGAGVEFWSWSDKYNYDNRRTESDAGINVNAGGQIGIEYDFNAMKVPFLVSLDLRAMLGLPGGGIWYHAGLGLRYTF